VEGYGRRKYQKEYYRFLTFAISSNDETIDHLEILFETGSLTNKVVYDEIHSKLVELGKKLNKFLERFNSPSDMKRTNKAELN
jgi:four helix bundle protein